MAKTKQEKEDAKREREYEKKHKRKYRLTPGDICLLYTSPSPRDA